MQNKLTDKKYNNNINLATLKFFICFIYIVVIYTMQSPQSVKVVKWPAKSRNDQFGGKLAGQNLICKCTKKKIISTSCG